MQRGKNGTKLNDMLRIAVQSKGRLYEDTMNLLAEADIKFNSSKRTLLVQSRNFPLEVLYLRDDDIPQSVALGVADIGIVGENEFVERHEHARIVTRLGFSRCRLSLAIPKSINYDGLTWFNGKKISTSYPNILQSFLTKMGIFLPVFLCVRRKVMPEPVWLQQTASASGPEMSAQEPPSSA